MSIIIREEIVGDDVGIDEVLLSAFPKPDECQLVRALRNGGAFYLSLVAVSPTNRIIGHLLFTPVTINGQFEGGQGLAPLAVHSDFQRSGCGKLLMNAGLEMCKARNVAYIVVLGHKSYYPKFGFVPASKWKFDNEYGATDAFMAIVLDESRIPLEGGLVKYHRIFSDIGC